MQFDVYDAQMAGFKSTVDLLISYPLEFFRRNALEFDLPEYSKNCSDFVRSVAT